MSLVFENLVVFSSLFSCSHVIFQFVLVYMCALTRSCCCTVFLYLQFFRSHGLIKIIFVIKIRNQTF